MMADSDSLHLNENLNKREEIYRYLRSLMELRRSSNINIRKRTRDSRKATGIKNLLYAAGFYAI